MFDIGFTSFHRSCAAANIVTLWPNLQVYHLPTSGLIIIFFIFVVSITLHQIYQGCYPLAGSNSESLPCLCIQDSGAHILHQCTDCVCVLLLSTQIESRVQLDSDSD